MCAPARARESVARVNDIIKRLVCNVEDGRGNARRSSEILSPDVPLIACLTASVKNVREVIGESSFDISISGISAFACPGTYAKSP